jgi:hypothetical protein
VRGWLGRILADEDGFKKVNFDNAQMYLKHRVAYSSGCFGPEALTGVGIALTD